MDSSHIAARLEALPFKGYVLRLVLVIALGGFFELYDLFLTTYLVPTLIKEGLYALRTPGVADMNAVATFVASLFLGMFVGAGLLGRLPDKYGRKAVFTWALIGYSLCTLIMAFQTEPLWINFWRFLAAIGIGLEQVTIVTYTSELVASRFRGRAIALTQIMSFLAVPAVAAVSWALIPTAYLGVEGWRWVVIIGASGAVLIWIMRRAIPESPIWLAEQGRTAEAEKVMAGIEAKVLGGGYALAPVAAQKHLEARPVRVSENSRWAAIFAPEVRGRILLMVVVNVCITVGYYGFGSWVPTLLLAKGINTTKSMEYSILIAIAAPLAPAVAMLVADKFERKFQVMFTCTMCALLGIAFSMQNTPAIVIVIGFLLTLNNGWMSASYHTYQAEMFPAAIRGQAVGFVYSWSRLSAVFCAFLISFFLSHYGTLGVFSFITASMTVIVISLMLFGPKTNKLLAS